MALPGSMKGVALTPAARPCFISHTKISGLCIPWNCPVKLRLTIEASVRIEDTRRRGSKEQQSGDVTRLKVWVPEAPTVEKPRAVHNAAALAYMGDAIYELYVRRYFLTPPQTMDKYNKRVMALVCCEAQHALLVRLVKRKILTDEEMDVLRWGKNIGAGHKRAKRRAGGIVYNSASALETLIGYLYLTNVVRLEEVMGQLGFDDEEITLLNTKKTPKPVLARDSKDVNPQLQDETSP